MARYQVALIARPDGWTPATPDDVPAQPAALLEAVAEEDGLFAAVRRAIEHNQQAERAGGDRWAVVVEPGVLGRTWRSARLCTPLSYKVTAIWWPDGWEPSTPFDVPNCVWRAQGDIEREQMTYRRALATVRSLNRQALDKAGPLWYVVVAVENEPVSKTVSYDPAGTETSVEVRRLHVVRCEQGSRGDCSHCPAHAFNCAEEDLPYPEQTTTATQVRAPGD